MTNVRILLVAEGSGGHVIPALEVSRALQEAGAQVRLLYAHRKQTADLVQELMTRGGVTVDAHAFLKASGPLRGPQRMWAAGGVWRMAHRHLRTFQPHAVVGFGGWVSVPVVLAARQRNVPIVLHEQNVTFGRANRFLLPWVDHVAVSFEATRAQINGTPATVTGLPIRQPIGMIGREAGASRLGGRSHGPTVLIVGGSQGSRAINQLVTRLLRELSGEQRATWQFVHLTGAGQQAAVQEAYAAAGVSNALVRSHLSEIELAYAMSDVVIARAGASTVAELARCGKPAILLPYAYATRHQRANAKLVESVGAGIWLEEATTSPRHLLGVVRQLMDDAPLRRRMGDRMQILARPHATLHLAKTILGVARRIKAKAKRSAAPAAPAAPAVAAPEPAKAAPQLSDNRREPLTPPAVVAMAPPAPPTYHNSPGSGRPLLNGKLIHFIGIGGIGMSGLAKILRERGHAVSGCDAKHGRSQRELQQQGLTVGLGHHPSHITDEVGLVIYSSAISSNEPELRKARSLGIPTISRGELLAELASTKRLVAVAGAHGKTTTSGMAGQLLIHAGWDPTVIVGGHMLSLGSNVRFGRGRYLVAETDESDGSFLLLTPSIAVVTNVDREHLNHYHTFEKLVAAFRQFTSRLGPEGTLIRCADDPIAREALSHPRELTYGLHDDADVRATRIRRCGWGSEFLASYQGQRLGSFQLQIPGTHNILNALAIVSVGLTLDLPMLVVREALLAFQGTARRFQVVELPNDIWLVDDYAHHPSEIRATLAADPFHGRHQIAVFQPHRFSRTKMLEEQFTTCFDRADGVIVTDIYSAFEEPIPGVSGERLVELIKAHGHPCVRYVPRQELREFLAHFIQPRDTVFFLGAGDIGELYHDVAARLRTVQRAAR
ncbi:MAG: UDP-N-acetylmuramate--L-alanine ligase [Candidatus Omnitrophica bacterium]|nr:UDP-N-acetylmuramate--L-alanine ligase [Candidatus Omnitrophota bacterium]